MKFGTAKIRRSFEIRKEGKEINDRGLLKITCYTKQIFIRISLSNDLSLYQPKYPNLIKEKSNERKEI